MNRLSIEELNKLPQEIITNVKNTLTAYNSCQVEFKNGKYDVIVGSYLLEEYPNDFKVIGEVFKEDIFTNIELIENYINAFKSYPKDYKGKKDFKILNEMKNSRKIENGVLSESYGKINNDGNFEIVGTRELNK